MDINNICPHCMREITGSRGDVCPHCGKNPGLVAAVRHQLKPYTILQGKYLVGEVLGEGGFGITYMGLDINLEIRVAIKEFYPNGYATREANVTTELTAYTGQSMDVVYKWRDNFLKEARSLAKCAHLPGVVGVKDFFQENNTAYIIQEYLEGQTIKEYAKARGGRIPAEQLFSAIEPVILALAEIHKEGLIHRDISPDNIMLLNNGQMKLLDFGAARDYTESGEKSLSVLLKPGYAPEEQYRTRGNQGPWTDIYALAGTIYKCITGITPPEAMERMRQDELQRPSALGVAIAPQAESALMKAMAVYAENRYQTVGEFHRDLYAKAPVGMGAPVGAAAPVGMATPVGAAASTGAAAPVGTHTSGSAKNKVLLGALAGAAVLAALVLLIGVITMGNKSEAYAGKEAEASNEEGTVTGEAKLWETEETVTEEAEPQTETQAQEATEVTEATEAAEEPETVDMEQALAAYQGYIDNCVAEVSNWHEGGCDVNCALIYVNDDQIPECYFYYSDAENPYFGETFLLWYKDGQVFEIEGESYFSWMLYQERGNRIQIHDFGGSISSDDFYEFSDADNRFELIGWAYYTYVGEMYYIDDGTGDKDYDWWDDPGVGEAAYNEYIASFGEFSDITLSSETVEEAYRVLNGE